jgi:hypothetical protein
MKRRLRTQETHDEIPVHDLCRREGGRRPCANGGVRGLYRGGERLEPTSSATTVRVAGGKTQVLNGPYAETKEQLAGYYVVEVPDLDAALTWAARCPGASHGAIEVRPLGAM